MQLLTLREGVTDLEDTVVGQSHDITGIGFLDGALALCHELGGRGETDGLPLTYQQIGLVADELTAAYLTEGDAGTVVRIDVGCDLEDKPGEFLFFWIHHALLGLGGTRTGCYLHKAVQQFLYTEIVQGGAEKDWSHLGSSVGLHIKFWINTIYQLQVFTQLLSILFSNNIINKRVTAPLDRCRGVGGEAYLHLLSNSLLIGCEQIEFVLIDVIYTFELGSLVDRPRQRTYLNLQFLFQLIEEVKRITALTVHFVDEDDDGSVSHPAHIHQLPCLCLHTFCSVHHDDGRVNGCQRTVCVFGKVLVSRGVEDVNLVFYVGVVGCIVELHHGGTH